MKRYDYVLFDLDGTLIYTLEDLRVSLNYALAACGLPPRTLEETRGFVGNGIRRLVARALPEGEADAAFPAAYAAFSEHYAQHACDSSAPYPGIPALLDELAARGIPTAVITNKGHSDAVPMIRRYFGERVRVTVGKKPENAPKPAPQAIYEAMAALEAPPERCVYVGDSDVDWQTAVNAGLDCLLVTWGYRDEALLGSLGARALLHTPEELLDYVREKEN